MELLEQLPSLSEPYRLSEEQIASYQKNGHIYLKGVANEAEVCAYRPVINELVKEFNNRKQPMQERNTYSRAFIQIINLWLRSEAAKRFVLAQRFAKIAADLMGVDGVRIYHDQALFKEPGGGHTPWHQDQIYWPVDTDNTITMWMPLVNIPPEIGTMTFASASHLLGCIYKLVISDESHNTLQEFIDSKNFDLVTYGGMSAGDATFHAGWTLHSAPGNPTDTMREIMTIIYVADGARVVEPDTQARKNSVEKRFPGLVPGDIIDTPTSPLVYSRRK
jgi:ectoine hydroxylase-related dioxygenase (phytanoyl-CoA dioxygenase family)